MHSSTEQDKCWKPLGSNYLGWVNCFTAFTFVVVKVRSYESTTPRTLPIGKVWWLQTPHRLFSATLCDGLDHSAIHFEYHGQKVQFQTCFYRFQTAPSLWWIQVLLFLFYLWKLLIYTDQSIPESSIDPYTFDLYCDRKIPMSLNFCPRSSKHDKNACRAANICLF